MQENSPTKPLILAVDDEHRNLRLLEAMLIPLGYDVLTACNGSEALEIIGANPIDLILLDVMMPGMDGLEVTRRLKAREDTKLIPIVVVTSLTGIQDRVNALEAGVDDFLSKPVDNSELTARVRSLLKVKAYHDQMKNREEQLESDVALKNKQLVQTLDQLKTSSLETIFRLTRAAEYKDEDTAAHIQRMSNYSALVARKLGLAPDEVENILYAAPMHDLGKIGTPDRILLKPAKLTADEWEIMKKHSEIGGQILEGSSTEIIKLGKSIALTHHEKWNGEGYPRGLQGDEIPLVGRIVAIADVFDALTSKRPYKPAYPVGKSLDIIRESRASHFDPDVVDAFMGIADEILSVREKCRDTGPSKLFQLYS